MTDRSKEEYFLEQLNDGIGFWVKSKARLAHAKSPFQDIEVLETDFGRTLRIDDYFMTSDNDEFFYHENMIHPAGISHYAPKRALIIGGGDGGAAEEYLKYPSMEEVVMVEIDEMVVNFCKEHLPLVHRGAFDDSRLSVVIADGKKYVEECQNQFDLMMLDLTDPFGPSEALYRVDFFEHCRRILGPEGVLSMHLGSPIMRPNVFHRVYSSLKTVFDVVRPYLVYVPLYGTIWGMATASDQTDPLSLNNENIEERLKTRKINDLQYYNGDTHQGVFALPNYVRDLLMGNLRPITEQDPMDEPGLDPQNHIPLKVVRRD
ncbi:MAG: spermidine synthase [Betaproteobacteria bacterium TMED22]|nr:MAG: spermidine synthase [Betaproteobacteria bacterium TMED22]